MRWLVVLLCMLPEVALAQSPTRSVGLPNRGRLRDAVALRESARIHLTHEPARYGTTELVTLIEASVAAVRRRHPGTPRLVVGDLSRRRGGRFPPHRSHQAGRDADVGFFYVDQAGRPYATEEFIRVGRGGRCVGVDTPCQLDVRRTWDLVAAMLTDEAQVQYLVVSPHIRDLLLDEAVRRGVPSDLITRFRVVTHPMRGSAEHRNHLHVRVFCAPDDRPRCREEGPLHPWYRYPQSADPSFVAQSRERARERFAAEVDHEPVARERRRRARERRDAADRAAAAARRAAEERRERILARRRRAREAREAELRAERDTRRARLERRRAALEAQRRERERLRAMSPAERRAHVEAQREAERQAEAARRAELRRIMEERAEARREAARRRREERRARHRAREAEQEAEERARRASYLATIQARRSQPGSD